MNSDKALTQDSPISWKHMLQAVPVHNEAANPRFTDNGLLTVTIKNKKPDFMFPPISWIVPFSPQKDITLDSLGTEIWKWCDGKSTVETIVDNFKDAHQLTFHEARTGVVDYLKKLIQRGVIAVIIQEEK